jgi:hypothetical protein
MAGAGYKNFASGDVLTSVQVDTFLMEQSVMVFASASARDTALSGVLAEGMTCYLSDTDLLYSYNGSAWQDQLNGGTWVDLLSPGLLVNGWVPHSASAVPGYRITGDVVELRGLIKNGTLGAVAFTLPVGFWPPSEQYFPAALAGGIGQLSVNTAGSVIASGASNAYYSLNCSFSVTR